MMRAYIKLADTLSTSIGKAFSWCIVILMGGTCYEVMMATYLISQHFGILTLVCRCTAQY